MTTLWSRAKAWPPWVWTVALVAICVAVLLPSALTPLFSDDAYEIRRAVDGDWHHWMFAYNYSSPNGDVPWWFGQVFERRVVRVLPSMILSGELRVFGYSALALHLTGVGLVAATAAVIQRILARWTGDPPAATLAALVFAVHPAAGEMAAFACDLPIVVAGLASAITVLYWDRLRRSGARKDLAGALIAGFVAITSYESAILLPIGIAAFDAWLLRGKADIPGGRWRPRLLLLGLLVLYVPIVMWVQSGTEHPDFEAMRPLGTVFHALRIDTEAYLAKLFLLFDPAEPSSYWFLNKVGELAAVAILLVPIVALVLGTRPRRVVVLGMIAFGALLAPPLVVRAAIALLNTPTFRQIYLPIGFGLVPVLAFALRPDRRRAISYGAVATFALVAAVQTIRFSQATILGSVAKLTAAARTTLADQDQSKTLLVIGDNRCGFHPRMVWPGDGDTVRLFPAAKQKGEEVALTAIDDHTLDARAPSGFDRIPLDKPASWSDPPGTYNQGKFYTVRHPAFTRAQTTLAIPGATIEVVERTDAAPTVLRAHLDRPLSQSIVLVTHGCDAATIVDMHR